MTWDELRNLPDCLSPEKVQQIFGTNFDKDCSGIHESVLQSFQVLAKVREYLEKEVPHSVILEMLNHVKSDSLIRRKDKNLNVLREQLSTLEKQLEGNDPLIPLRPAEMRGRKGEDEQRASSY